MALTKKQLAMIDSCPILKSMKSDLISVLGVEESSSSGSDSSNTGSDSSNTDSGSTNTGSDSTNTGSDSTNNTNETTQPTDSNNESQTIEKRNISVTVTGGENPVQGATVELVQNGETVASSTTGSAGGCTLTNVEDGSYVINVTKEGFEIYSESVTTSVDNDELSIELTASSPSP